MVGSVVLLGPKDFPIIARAAGRLTGKAVGYLQTMRGQVDTIMQHSQSNNLQKELREAMSQLDAIRHEVRTGMSIMQPRPFVRESFENHGSATKLVKNIENTLDRFVESADTKSNIYLESSSKPSVELQRQATAFARFAGHLSGVGRPGSAQRMGPISTQQQGKSSEGGENLQQVKLSQEIGQEIRVLPISALSMGLFQPKPGPGAGGSDLMLECLAERKIAQQALEFFEQPNEQSKTST